MCILIAVCMVSAEASDAGDVLPGTTGESEFEETFEDVNTAVQYSSIQRLKHFLYFIVIAAHRGYHGEAHAPGPGKQAHVMLAATFCMCCDPLHVLLLLLFFFSQAEEEEEAEEAEEAEEEAEEEEEVSDSCCWCCGLLCSDLCAGAGADAGAAAALV
jgi:hypothetical protein